jgi:hypothetical protein
MSKKQLNITDNVMSRIESGQVHMKPKWYFLLGSLGMIMGVIGLIIISVFLVSLASFSLRTHGPMGEIRYQQMLSEFPWWALVVAIACLSAGILLLKKYDFSYKNNFILIVAALVGSVIIAGLAVDYLNIDSQWARGGLIRRLYQQYDGGYGRRFDGQSKSDYQKNEFRGQGRGMQLRNINN